MALPKNKNILGIFAHPDDDVFGPGGTINLLSRQNNFYEVLITNGQAGTNQITGKKEKDLGEKRKKESEMSAKILGIKKVFFLNYQDGFLANNLYHEIAETLEKIIKKNKIEIILTYEPRGVSGHIDHVFVSMVSSYIAQKLKLTIYYFCLNHQQRKLIKDYFIYFPEGYQNNQINLVVDIKKVINKKTEAIKAHLTQKKDGVMIINHLKKTVFQREYFIVKKF